MSLLTTVSPVALLVAGFVVCFFGYRLLRLTLALVGFGVGFVLGLSIASLLPHTSHVFAVVIGAVCGILLAVLATLLYKFGVFLLGAAAGAVVAGMIIPLTGWHHPTLIRLVAALICGILTLLIERRLVSILSAFAGSWGMAHAAFQLIGRHHHMHKPAGWHVLMIACWLVLALIGAGVQLRSGSRRKP